MTATILALLSGIVTLANKLLAALSPTAGQSAVQPIVDATNAVNAANAAAGDTSAIENEFSK